MALLPGETDDSFIREVDEEYRRAQLSRLWRRWGRWLIGAIVVFLVALGGLLWWRAEQQRAAGIDGEDYAQALARLEAGNAVAAAPVLKRLAASGGGYAPLAKLTQAANLVTAGDTPSAVRIYTALAADAAQPRPMRDLALIKATRLEFDTLPPATVVTRLQGLSVPGNPWFGVAGEMTAMARLKQNQPALAGALLAGIARDTTLPSSTRGRAQQLGQALGANVPTGVQ